MALTATSKRTGQTYPVLEVRPNGDLLLADDQVYGGYFPNPGSAQGVRGGNVSFVASAAKFELNEKGNA